MLKQSEHSRNILLKNKLLITLLVLQVITVMSMFYLGYSILQMITTIPC